MMLLGEIWKQEMFWTKYVLFVKIKRLWSTAQIVYALLVQLVSILFTIPIHIMIMYLMGNLWNMWKGCSEIGYENILHLVIKAWNLTQWFLIVQEFENLTDTTCHVTGDVSNSFFIKRNLEKLYIIRKTIKFWATFCNTVLSKNHAKVSFLRLKKKIWRHKNT